MIWKVFGLVANGILKDTWHTLAGSDVATMRAKAVYGNTALAVDCSFLAVTIGDTYADGKFYHDGVEVAASVNPSDALSQIQSQLSSGGSSGSGLSMGSDVDTSNSSVLVVDTSTTTLGEIRQAIAAGQIVMFYRNTFDSATQYTSVYLLGGMSGDYDEDQGESATDFTLFYFNPLYNWGGTLTVWCEGTDEDEVPEWHFGNDNSGLCT